MIELSREYLIGLAEASIEKIVLVLAIVVAAQIIIKLVDRFMGRLFDKTEFDRTLEKFVQKTTVSALWLITLGVVLVVLGVDISAVIASFGVIGFVVGFALKDTLGNFASGVMILMNKPFRVGDDIKIITAKNVEIQGRVKTVDMACTKIITKDNDKVTLPNSVIWGSPIINYTAYKDSRSQDISDLV